MNPEVSSLDISKAYACIFRPVKAQSVRIISIFHLSAWYSSSRGAHALTGLMFAPSVITF